MIFYFILIVYFIACLFGKQKYKTDTQKKVVIFLFLLPLFLIAALRDKSMGPDTITYFNKFYYLKSFESLKTVKSSWMEFGYVAISYIIGKLGFSYYFFQIVISSFVFFSIGKFLFSYSDNIPMACFLILANNSLFGMMNVVRMWIAIAILLFSIDYIKKGKIFQFLLVVLVASLFHFSAWLFIIMYPLARARLNMRRICILIIASVVISVFAMPFFTYLTNVIGRYGNYLTESRFNVADNMATKIGLVVNICFFLFASFVRLWESIDTPGEKNFDITEVTFEKISYVALTISLCISIVGLSNNIMGRVSHYFSVFTLVTTPESINRLKNTNNRIIMTLIIISMMFLKYYIIITYRPEWYQVTPYKMFF